MTGRVILCALLALSATGAAHASGGVDPAAAKLFEIPVLGLPVTNSILTTWIVSLLILLVVRLMVKRPQLVPSKGQAIVEAALSGIRGIVEPIVGKKAIGAALPLLLCLFVFILLQNWAGLLPGVGSIGMEHEGHFIPFIRPGTADMNGTLALAAISMLAWFYLCLRYAGLKAMLFETFGNKANKSEVPTLIYYFLFLVFFFVGLIDVVSICFRPVSLSFRLYGNVFGGENLLHQTFPYAFPFYFLELLIGLVQALVFTLLTSVYIGLICNPGEEHEHAEGAHH
jgi:F-type H+-transporting ATPase subunit a